MTTIPRRLFFRANFFLGGQLPDCPQIIHRCAGRPRRVPRHDGAASPGRVGGPARVREGSVHGAPRGDRALRSRDAGFSRASRGITVTDAPSRAGTSTPAPARSFEECSFPKYLHTQLLASGFRGPSPVQAQAWPWSSPAATWWRWRPRARARPWPTRCRRGARQRAAVLGRAQRRRPNRGGARADARARRADRGGVSNVRREQQNHHRRRVRRRARARRNKSCCVKKRAR